MKQTQEPEITATRPQLLVISTGLGRALRWAIGALLDGFRNAATALRNFILGALAGLGFVLWAVGQLFTTPLSKIYGWFPQEFRVTWEEALPTLRIQDVADSPLSLFQRAIGGKTLVAIEADRARLKTLEAENARLADESAALRSALEAENARLADESAALRSALEAIQARAAQAAVQDNPTVMDAIISFVSAPLSYPIWGLGRVWGWVWGSKATNPPATPSGVDTAVGGADEGAAADFSDPKAALVLPLLSRWGLGRGFLLWVRLGVAFYFGSCWGIAFAAVALAVHGYGALPVAEAGHDGPSGLDPRLSESGSITLDGNTTFDANGRLVEGWLVPYNLTIKSKSDPAADGVSLCGDGTIIFKDGTIIDADGNLVAAELGLVGPTTVAVGPFGQWPWLPEGMVPSRVGYQPTVRPGLVRYVELRPETALDTALETAAGVGVAAAVVVGAVAVVSAVGAEVLTPKQSPVVGEPQFPAQPQVSPKEPSAESQATHQKPKVRGLDKLRNFGR